MKEILIILFLAITSTTVSSQSVKMVKQPSLQIGDSVKISGKTVDHKFLNKGITLLNVAGSFPDHSAGIMAKSKDTSKLNSKSEEQLVSRTLLFTGKLSDHLSRPFIFPTEKKAGEF